MRVKLRSSPSNTPQRGLGHVRQATLGIVAIVVATVPLFGLLMPSSAAAGNRDYRHDKQNFKSSAADAYVQIHDVYAPATESALTACDTAAVVEQTEGDLAGAAAWGGVSFLANINLNTVSPSAVTQEQLLESSIKDFVPWRGPGNFKPAQRERDFGRLVSGLRRDSRETFLEGIMLLDDANTATNSHDCAGARTKFADGVHKVEDGRMQIAFRFRTIDKLVKKWTS